MLELGRPYSQMLKRYDRDELDKIQNHHRYETATPLYLALLTGLSPGCKPSVLGAFLFPPNDVVVVVVVGEIEPGLI